MEGLTEKLILVALGWLLGLLGPLIVDTVRTKRGVRAVQGALVIELDELQIRLAESVFRLALHLGAFDAGLIRWLLASYQTYQGLYVDPETAKLLEEASRKGDDFLAGMNAKRAHGGGQTMIPRTFAVPVLESAMALLPQLSRDIQQKLLEIRTLLRFLDDDAKEIREQHNLTLDKALANSHGLSILGNIERLSRHTLNTSRSISDLAQAIVISLRG